MRKCHKGGPQEGLDGVRVYEIDGSRETPGQQDTEGEHTRGHGVRDRFWKALRGATERRTWPARTRPGVETKAGAGPAREAKAGTETGPEAGPGPGPGSGTGAGAGTESGSGSGSGSGTGSGSGSGSGTRERGTREAADGGGTKDGQAGGSKRGHQSGEGSKRGLGEQTKRDRAETPRDQDEWQCTMCEYRHIPEEERKFLEGRSERYDGEHCLVCATERGGNEDDHRGDQTNTEGGRRSQGNQGEQAVVTAKNTRERN